MSQLLQPRLFTDLHPVDLVRLAFYAINSAVKPIDIHLDLNTDGLETEIAHLETLPPHARFQLGLNLLQHWQRER